MSVSYCSLQPFVTCVQKSRPVGYAVYIYSTGWTGTKQLNMYILKDANKTEDFDTHGDTASLLSKRSRSKMW